jgi:hypothetical protein
VKTVKVFNLASFYSDHNQLQGGEQLMEIPLVIESQSSIQLRGSYDVVSVDRDATHNVHLRFLNRDQVGRTGSHEIHLDAATAEALLVMLSRELDSDDR